MTKQRLVKILTGRESPERQIVVVLYWLGEKTRIEKVEEHVREHVMGHGVVVKGAEVFPTAIIKPHFEEPREIKRLQVVDYIRAVEKRAEAPLLTPTFFTAAEIRGSYVSALPTPAFSAALIVPQPTFYDPPKIQAAPINTSLPKVILSVPEVVPLKPEFKSAQEIHAQPFNAHVPGADADVDFEPLELLLGVPASRLVGERAVVVLAKKTGQDYLELLKRVLRELYRVGAGGLPTPIDVLTKEEFEVKKPLIKAGGSICVIDVDEVCRGEGGGLDDGCLAFIAGRVREAYSQGLGYLVLYGKDFAELKKWISLKVVGEGGFEAPLQRYVEVEGRADPRLVGLMFAGSPRTADMDVEQYAMYLDVLLLRAVEAAAREYAPYVKRGIDESLMHYGLKALVVKYLEKMGIKLENIKTEYAYKAEPKDAETDRVEKEYAHERYVFDVYVEGEGLAVEVETLYGTVVPATKLMETGEKAWAVNRLWIVIPPPQLFLFLRDVLKARKALRKKFMHKGLDVVEFYTIDLFREELIPIAEYVNRLKKIVKRQTT